jgi:hypothetical protein
MTDNLPAKSKAAMQQLIEQSAMCNTLNPSAVGMVLADANKALAKAIKRATVPESMERIELAPTRGPVHEFTGQSLYDAEYTDKQGRVLLLELFQTRAGRLVVFQSKQDERDTFDQVHVLEADNRQGVMEACGWSDMARTMAKALKWGAFRIEVE